VIGSHRLDSNMQWINDVVWQTLPLLMRRQRSFHEAVFVRPHDVNYFAECFVCTISALRGTWDEMVFNE
jgi:hypothetical protein